MCRPSSFSDAPPITKKPALFDLRRNALILFGTIFCFSVGAFPVILSEIIGGWTREFTSSASIVRRDMTGQVAIVSGANTGIGYHTALELASQNATVIVASRNRRKGREAIERMHQELSNDQKQLSQGADLRFLPLDLSSLGSVRDFVSDFQALGLPLHTLVLNAGVMKSPGEQFVGRKFAYGFDTTKEGFEAHIGINHIGHFFLTRLLQENLVKSAPSRVVSVSSMAEGGSYEEGIRFSTWKPLGDFESPPAGYEDGLAYGQSKLANIFFAKELAKKLNGTGVTAYSCHPGVIITELGRYLDEAMVEEASTQGWLEKMVNEGIGRWFQMALMTSRAGALTQLHLATADEASLVNGAFYHPVGKHVGHGSHQQGNNSTLQELVWTETERMIREAGFQF